MKRNKEFLPIALVIFFAILFVVAKWSYLSLPAFWDEGFPYAYSIRYLVDHHLTMMPSGMPELYSTGHPTLFYFLAAAWMKIFGAHMFVAHLFILIISVLDLFILYRFAKTFFNPSTGVIAVMLLVTRAIFAAQSTQLLPETLVMLFTLLALHAWLQNKKWMYVLWASLLVLTKEAGLVLPLTLCLWELITVIRYRKISVVQQIKNRFQTALPIFAAALFFTVQRLQMGWFFFPRHVGWISFNPEEIRHKLWDRIGAQLFLNYGGIATTIIFFSAILIFFIRKLRFSAVQRRSVYVILLFLFAFALFSSINFYSARYILSLYPFWYMITAFVFLEALKGIPKLIPLSIFFITANFQMWYTMNLRTPVDHDLGYADCVSTQLNAINWCVMNHYQDKNIFAQQQMQRAMQSDAAGFIEAGQEFKHVGNIFDSQTALFIFTCNETDPSEDAARKTGLRLLYKSEIGKSRTEIYLPEYTPIK